MSLTCPACHKHLAARVRPGVPSLCLECYTPIIGTKTGARIMTQGEILNAERTYPEYANLRRLLRK